MKDKQLHIWLYLGLLGGLTFLLLHSAVDFHAGASLRSSSDDVEQQVNKLATELGFSVDSLSTMLTLDQNYSYFEKLQAIGDTADLQTNPAALNNKAYNTSTWAMIIGRLDELEDATINDASDLYNNAGYLRIHIGQRKRVVGFEHNPRKVNPTFVPGDSLFSVTRHIVQDLFGYQLTKYNLINVDIEDTLNAAVEHAPRRQTLGNRNGRERSNTTTFIWERVDPTYAGPARLELEVEPMVREVQRPYGSSIQYGVSLVNFTTKDPRIDAIEIDNPRRTGVSTIFFYIALALLVSLIFFVGLRQIFKGHVDWKRALIVMGLISLGTFGWRMIYFSNTFFHFTGDASELILIVNTLLFSLACGLFAAMAYIGWESLARRQKHKQLPLIDAFWRRRFFFRETGQSLLMGYGLGGVLLGLFAAGLYVMKDVYVQSDSVFGFSAAGNEPQWLTINLDAWVYTWIFVLGYIGVVYSFLREKIKNDNYQIIAATLVIGLLLTGGYKLVSTTSDLWEDVILYLIVVLPLVYAYYQTGLVTVSTGWWFMVVVLLTSPFWGSPSLSVAIVAWVQLIVLIVPLLFGIVAYRYGGSVAEFEGYVPEYEERMANQLRVEKEIEIARESQFKLMPLQPPMVDGLDLYGFFLPSFEVGGDYFDYVLNRNGQGQPEAVTLTIVDVSGKAMKAAMHAVFTSGLLLSRMRTDQPASILKEIAPTLFHKTDAKTFITCLIGQYNLKQNKLTLANAGHCLPVIKRNGKAKFVPQNAPRFPLGVREEVPYCNQEIQLQDGDFILFYSDGLPEAVNDDGDRFGYDHLIELVEDLDTARKTSQELATDIKRRIQKFSDYQLADDTTIICFKVGSSISPVAPHHPIEKLKS